MFKVLDRYIYKELLSISILAIIIFTFSFLANQILRLTELFINKGVHISTILKLLVYTIPSFLSLTAPMAILASAIITFSRISSNNELTAMRSSGISFYRLIRPVLIFSTFAFLITMYITVDIAPWSNRSFKNLIFDTIKTKATVGLEEGVFNDSFEGLVIYVSKVHTPTDIEGILISDYRDQKEPHLVIADRGTFITDSSSLRVILRLQNGSIHRQSKEPQVYQRIFFSSYDLQLEIDKNLIDNNGFKKNHREMTLAEIRKEIIERSGDERGKKRLQMEYNKKFALPFACIVFGLLAPSVGITARRSGKTSGFGLSIGIILFYYTLLTLGENFALEGLIPPILSTWAPNVLLWLFGLYLTYSSR